MIIQRVEVKGLIPPSTNFLYKPSIGRKGRKRFPYLRLDEYARQFKEDFKLKAISQIDIPCGIIVQGIVGSYVYGLSLESFWRKDVSNITKAVEDSVFELLEFDDSQVVLNSERKIISETPFILIHLGFIINSDSVNDVEALKLLLEISQKELTYGR